MNEEEREKRIAEIDERIKLLIEKIKSNKPIKPSPRKRGSLASDFFTGAGWFLLILFVIIGVVMLIIFLPGVLASLGAVLGPILIILIVIVTVGILFTLFGKGIKFLRNKRS